MVRKLAFLILLVPCAQAGAQAMQPGEWQFTTTMSSAMTPKPQTSTVTRCVKPGDTDPSRLGQDKSAQSDCKMTQGKPSGGSYAWEVVCPKSGMKGSGTARVTGTTVESEMRMTGETQGHKIDMQTKTVGKRLGDCKS